MSRITRSDLEGMLRRANGNLESAGAPVRLQYGTAGNGLYLLSSDGVFLDMLAGGTLRDMYDYAHAFAVGIETSRYYAC